jgi:Outer membrane protein beta-barrel domain
MLRPALLCWLALACCPLDALTSRARADEGSKPEAFPSWGFELGLGTMTSHDGPYMRRLGDFGFDTGFDTTSGLKVHVALDRRVLHYFAVGVAYAHLESYEYRRDQSVSDARLVPGNFEWTTKTMSAYARAGYPVIPEFYPFVHLGLGAAWTSSTLALEGSPTSEDTVWGPSATIGVGVHATTPHFGLALGYLHTFASVLENDLGDEHDSGGSYAVIALRFQFMEDEL